MSKLETFIVEEILRKEVSIECESIEDGESIVQESYRNCDIVLDYDDHYSTNVYTKSQVESNDNLINYYVSVKEPMPLAEFYKKLNEMNLSIRETVAIHDQDMFYNNCDNFLEFLNSKLTNVPLKNLTYKLISVDVENHKFIYEISGNCHGDFQPKCPNFKGCLQGVKNYNVKCDVCPIKNFNL